LIPRQFAPANPTQCRCLNGDWCGLNGEWYGPHIDDLARMADFSDYTGLFDYSE